MLTEQEIILNKTFFALLQIRIFDIMTSQFVAMTTKV